MLVGSLSRCSRPGSSLAGSVRRNWPEPLHTGAVNLIKDGEKLMNDDAGAPAGFSATPEIKK